MTQEFKPTWLMIKRHTKTGLLYFCKTTKPTLKEALKYKGSGLHWVKHIKKHGRDLVTTEWISLFDDMDECVQYANWFSIENDIVLSEAWANLVVETGLDHGCSRPMPITVRKKISSSKKGKSFSVSHLANLRGPKPIARKPKSAAMCNKLRGRQLSESHKSNISKSKKGKPVSAEHKEKLRVANIGNSHSPETKQKMSDSRKGKSINRKCKLVQQFDTDWNLISELTTNEFGELGFSKSSITKCCNNQYKEHRGFYWRYKL